MTHLNVAVRVRPMSQREVDIGSSPAVAVENNVIAVTNNKVPEQNAGDSRERVRRFAFDFCFPQETTQEQVFTKVEAIIGKSLKNRQHSCVLAYGQSSSGKTHTMMGFPHDPGLTPKLCSRVFDYFREAATEEEIKNMRVSVSYLEIYNEKVTDLLEETSCLGGKDSNLKIREHPKKGPYVQGLSELQASTPSELLTCLHTGNNRRRVGRTLTNPRSSRSHAVFCISFDGVKLHLVDLAGSERTGSRCYETSRFREGANINKSLVALGNVISALAEQSKLLRRRFVPFRDSALTWLLKDTLGGNSNTFMIATISASSACHSETVNTLRFGQRAKLIVFRPVAVEDPKERTIRELRTEIAKLRELLKLSQIAPRFYCEDQMSESAVTAPKPKVNHSDTLCEKGDVEEISDQPITNFILTKSTNQNNIPLNTTAESAQKQVSTQCNNSESTYKQTCISNSDVNLKELDNTNFNLVKEKLLPLIDVISTLDESKPVQTLSKTFSMDRQKSRSSYSSQESLQQSPKRNRKLPPLPLKQQSLSKSNSQESLPSPSQRKTATPPSRRSSITKPSLKTITQKKVLGPASVKKNAETASMNTKVDPVRKVPIKPRSQIVASVTSRLYNTANKKEAGNDTNEAPVRNEAPKELALCLEARNRLKELTQKALRAHKQRNREIQTERQPLLRMKEVSTDSRDLKLAVKEVKNAGTLDKTDLKDASVECKLPVENEAVVTRSCGTQSTENINPVNPFSFTKYLLDPHNSISSPIYTGAVNINISHNYMNNSTGNSVSDDGLDGTHNSVNFPTPDLISNHNSLEKHVAESEVTEGKQNTLESKIRFANYEINVSTGCEAIDDLKRPRRPERRYAKVCYVFHSRERLKNINVIGTFATQTCVIDNFMKDYSIPLKSFRPVFGKARIRIVDENTSKIQESIVMSQPLILSNSDQKDFNRYCIEEHYSNQSRGNSPKKQRMFKAMSNFLEEATTLMTNLSVAADNLKNHKSPLDNAYQLELTVNDISNGFEQLRRKRKNSPTRKTCSTQCESIYREDSCSQTVLDECYLLPINRYNELLEDSCKRLEDKISRAPRSRRSTVSDDCQNEFWPVFSQPAYNPWDIGNSGAAEDSSLESNPVTFSDYGSLPRKTHKRQRTPTCSPSAFLRQLTNMRRQVIETSREEFCNGSNR